MSTALSNLLRERKTKEKMYTHLLMGSPYGTYAINRDIEKFWKLYMCCVEKESVLSLAEKPIEETPILADVDLMVKKSSLDQHQFEQTRKVYTQSQVNEIVTVYQNALKVIVKNITEEALTCLLLEKDFSEKELNGEMYIKNGFHLHFPKLFLSRKAQEVYLIPIVQEKLTYLFKELGCNSPIDANSVNVHWLMYGSSKPGNNPYKVTKCFNAKCEEEDLDESLSNYHITNFDTGEPIACDGRVYELLPRILSTSLYDREEYYYKSNDSISTPILENYERIKTIRKQYAQLSIDEALIEAELLINMISPKRADERGDWLQVGCCLWNISQGDADGFSLWLEFSEQSPKFDEAGCIYTWNSMRDYKYTIGTLMFFAKQDNPEKYSEHVKSKGNGLIRETVLNGGHNDFAKLLFNEYETEFMCVNITQKTWYQFLNHVWGEDDSGIHLRERISCPNGIIMKQLTTLIGKLVDKMSETDVDTKEYQNKIKKAGDLIRGCKSAPTKDNIMKESREVFYSSKFYQQLNKDPNIIAFKNGVYDFNHMIFRDGKPEDYLSMNLPIDYVDYGSIDHPKVVEVLDFFRKVFPNKSIREYYLDQVCQVFVGGNKDKVVLFWTGHGNNGKTVTQTLFEKMLGKFAIKFNTTIITGKKLNNGSANPEMARAGDGVRWAVMEEPNPDEMINAGTLKWLTGNDSYWARDLYERGKSTREIEPMFKLHIICNKLPPIKDVDQAVKNRVRVIPFESQFVADTDCPANLEEQFKEKKFPMDKNFASKIPNMVQALAWFLIYRYKNLNRGERIAPSEVTVATDMYMKDNDIYRQFECQKIFTTPGAKIRPTELFENFRQWFQEECPGQMIPTKNTVTNYFSNKWGTVKKYWMDKTCVVPPESDDEDEQ